MWKNMFSMENPVMQALGVACDLLVYNILTALCCLPVVTAGAALTALSDVSLRAVRGDETGARGYFRAFRRSFPGGLLLGLLFLAAAIVLAVDYWAVGVYLPGSARLLRVPVLAAAVLLTAVALYAFFLQSRYENGLLDTLKNAAALAVGFFPRTLGMVVFTLGLWLVCLRFARQALPVLLLFGASLPAYVCALQFDKIFDIIDQNNEVQNP